MKVNKRPAMTDSYGMTVLEILIAVLILSLLTSALLRISRLGEYGYSRDTRMQCIALLGRNEAERMKAGEGSASGAGDTAYTTRIGTMHFVVERTTVEYQEQQDKPKNVTIQERQIAIGAPYDTARVRFRLLYPAKRLE